MTMQYTALQPVWHSKLGKQFEVGETFDLQHLTPDQIQSLIDGGVVTIGAVDAPARVSSDSTPAAEPIENPPGRVRAKRANSKEGE